VPKLALAVKASFDTPKNFLINALNNAAQQTYSFFRVFRGKYLRGNLTINTCMASRIFHHDNHHCHVIVGFSASDEGVHAGKNRLQEALRVLAIGMGKAISHLL